MGIPSGGLLLSYGTMRPQLKTRWWALRGDGLGWPRARLRLRRNQRHGRDARVRVVLPVPLGNDDNRRGLLALVNGRFAEHARHEHAPDLPLLRLVHKNRLPQILPLFVHASLLLKNVQVLVPTASPWERKR